MVSQIPTICFNLHIEDAALIISSSSSPAVGASFEYISIDVDCHQ